MQALWGEPATACAVFVDGKEAVPFRGVVTHHWLRAKHCTDDAVKARPGRERKRNGGAAQGSDSLASTLRFPRPWYRVRFSGHGLPGSVLGKKEKKKVLKRK